MVITEQVVHALEKAKTKVKRIEANAVAKEFRADSGWLCAVNDIIDRTVLAVRNELETAGK